MGAADAGASFAPAAPDDEDLVVAMMRELYVHDGLYFDEARARAALARLLADASLGRVWVARADGEPAGYLVLTLGYSLEFAGRDAFVDELYLREPFRGGGLGRRAIETAVAACRELGVEALHLEVERANTGAQGFYRRLGFHDHDRYLMTRWIAEAPPRE